MRRRTLQTHISSQSPGAQRSIARVVDLLESVKCHDDEPTACNQQVTLQHEGFFPVKKLHSAKRSPLETPVLEQAGPAEAIPAVGSGVRVYSVVWGKSNTRKHKTWEGDGRLEASATCWRLTSDTGASLGTTRASTELQLEPGSRLRIGNKELEIVEQLTSEHHTTSAEATAQPPFKKLKPNENAPRLFKRGLGGKPLIFPRPTDEHQWNENARKSSVRDVILDSLLSRTLRPHQRDGVLFLYECVMGFRNPRHCGAILADEMGLGKTLQSVALIWTLLKQGPYGKAVCKKVLVITPSSLCSNWSKEFTKWLGRERIQTYVVDKSHKASDFPNHPLTPVMIISYELFVRNFDSVEKCNFDLVVCDEGHRLKNSSVRATQLVQRLACRRRVLLTGTPVQNHLQEYFTLIDLVNPGVLDSAADFRTQYELPILAAQQPHCDLDTKLLAQTKSELLNRIISKFILRRTLDVMENYLPCKVELIVCCTLSPMQKLIYENVIDGWFNSENKNPFAAIATLRKICNHPDLVEHPSDERDMLVQSSGKLSVIDSILCNTVLERNENIVLVSYSTKFLDILQKLCLKRQLNYLRLDGSTPVAQRKWLVDSFNAHSAKIFLVSARAGGTGLNLTGASRLVLADGDWNPSNDLQALARIWRDGQKKNVTIYRLISTGTIEEKIFQRQLSKLSLSESVDDPDNVRSALNFSEEELKDLFTPSWDTQSNTHDLIQCPCRADPEYVSGEPETELPDGDDEGDGTVGVSQLKSWKHFGKPFTSEFLQDIGLQNDNVATFIFQKIINQSNIV